MENGKDKIPNIRQVTKNPFLNYYELDVRRRDGATSKYYMASRALCMDELYMFTPQKGPDGVAISSLYGQKRDHVVLIRQYRFPLGGYVYEFPAGLVEKGEDPHDTAVREMKEETGLDFTPLKVDSMYEKPYFTTVGMTDENCSLVYGISAGTVSREGLEETEDIEVVLADRKEAARILKEEKVALLCAYMLMHFLQHPDNPFPFSEAE